MEKNKMSIDIRKLDLKKFNLKDFSFEDSVDLIQNLTNEIQSGKLNVQDIQKAYILSNKLLIHSRNILEELTLTLETVDENTDQLQEILSKSSKNLFTKISEHVTNKNLEGVRVELESFKNTILSGCKSIIGVVE